MGSPGAWSSGIVMTDDSRLKTHDSRLTTHRTISEHRSVTESRVLYSSRNINSKRRWVERMYYYRWIGIALGKYNPNAEFSPVFFFFLFPFSIFYFYPKSKFASYFPLNAKYHGYYVQTIKVCITPYSSMVEKQPTIKQLILDWNTTQKIKKKPKHFKSKKNTNSPNLAGSCGSSASDVSGDYWALAATFRYWCSYPSPDLIPDTVLDPGEMRKQKASNHVRVNPWFQLHVILWSLLNDSNMTFIYDTVSCMIH